MDEQRTSQSLHGERIAWTAEEGWKIPNRPIIPYIEGDGIGPDIWHATQRILDAAVSHCYGGEKQIVWHEVFAGEKSHQRFGSWLPDETLEDIRTYRVAIKGPLTTPVGGGIRSLNVTLRQELDLYACIRPIRWFQGVPSPLKDPSRTNMVVFRENTEDVYIGIEWQADSEASKKLHEFITQELGQEYRPLSGTAIKPVSEFGSKRLIRMAIEYAIKHGRKSVTLMHKGNIMKFTEGAFRDWGYDLAREEFAGKVITEDELYEKYDGKAPEGMVILRDRIADIMFQHILLRPEEHDVIATLNLNGDYISDALAAQVGGVGMAPGANIGDGYALFEATHGTAPKYAGMDKANPSSLLLSGVMMLDHLGWTEAGRTIEAALERCVSEGQVTYDLARAMDGATELSSSAFADALIQRF